MSTQTATETMEVMSVPADMLALRPVEQPLWIAIPSLAKTTITGHTNARFHQRVTLTDVKLQKAYVFTGSGEDEMAMAIQGSNEKGTVQLQVLEGEQPYRMLSVLCEFSSQGPDGRLERSKVLAPRVLCEYQEPQLLKRMTWEICSEDGVDSDYNDSVIRITADINLQI
ncbi:Calcium-mediated lectin [Metarhizium album ARSEF 1941]|uniref:Calcium-mediated lectin n=1 Tax=Metarhizium album (strain ARSEF 1941) TaxID=1081103 RepID=A0A0B2WWN4_METAS|nr:Calcium-mediated lectin [Metarhizium album ARSEF 1941]KHN98478.1 Calcium-mediated lectin [Metarhizium album ARSEF 1941]